jgi:hypothetical protein
MNSFFDQFKNGLTYFMTKAKEQLSQMDSPRDLARFAVYPSQYSTGGKVTLLGREYPEITIDFLDGFL